MSRLFSFRARFPPKDATRLRPQVPPSSIQAFVLATPVSISSVYGGGGNSASSLIPPLSPPRSPTSTFFEISTAAAPISPDALKSPPPLITQTSLLSVLSSTHFRHVSVCRTITAPLRLGVYWHATHRPSLFPSTLCAYRIFRPFGAVQRMCFGRRWD